MPVPRTLVFCLLAAMSLAFNAGTAFAQAAPPVPGPDPEAIAQECIEAMRERTRKCVEEINSTGEKAVAGIKRLVEEEKPRAAYLLGKRASTNITRHSRRCCASLKRQAQRCAEELTSLGADELAEEVKAAAKRGCERIQTARANALMSIREALPKLDGDGDRPRRRDSE